VAGYHAIKEAERRFRGEHAPSLVGTTLVPLWNWRLRFPKGYAFYFFFLFLFFDTSVLNNTLTARVSMRKKGCFHAR